MPKGFVVKKSAIEIAVFAFSSHKVIYNKKASERFPMPLSTNCTTKVIQENGFLKCKSFFCCSVEQ
jgi:hypothetical protein